MRLLFVAGTCSAFPAWIRAVSGILRYLTIPAPLSSCLLGSSLVPGVPVRELLVLSLEGEFR